MIKLLSRCTRPFARLLLATVLTLTPVVSQPAHAQQNPNEGEPAEEGKGRPYDGYIATCALLMLAFFIVGKSARR